MSVKQKCPCNVQKDVKFCKDRQTDRQTTVKQYSPNISASMGA